MHYKNIQKYWMNAANDLKFEVVCPYIFKAKSGAEIEIDVLVKGFGAKNGMLIVTDFDKIEPYVDDIDEQGFGFSTMSDDDEPYSREGCLEVLEDWGRIKK